MNSTPKILVIGDVMLDRYVSGTVERVSPEAPVPVVKVQSEWSTLGGAANVAANVASLGATPILIGLVGNDTAGEELSSACKQQGIESNLFRSSAPTITKTRIISGQQIVRIDREEPHVWNSEQLQSLKDRLTVISAEVSVVLVSDYAKGTLSNEVLDLLFSWAKKNALRVIVDPKRSDWEAYHNPFLITPNLKELQLAAGYPVANDDNEVVKAARVSFAQGNAQNVLITRSFEGMTLIGEGSVFNVPAVAQEIFDVSGAGDTVLASVGVWLSEGKSLKESVLAANTAAGIAIGKRGTATVLRNELETVLALATSKVVSRESIAQLRESLKGKKVVFTNGCFDVLHKGHRKLLEEARSFGDVLVVGLNSDSSVKRLKGLERPVNSEAARASTLASNDAVNYVVAFEEDTPYELLDELRPDVLVKGGDYKVEDVVGKELVGEVKIVGLVEGVSTTLILG
ncbi:MAG: bifunctional heptose 7-phosphate kinase/heptose 1-phosphate adenyltransferase [Flavobacteriales bacterium]|nr:bifunctional heptose 7-phosphate kinase/heptose 1-phosphate adenyltransferase [Flavobacteriales bacterium]